MKGKSTLYLLLFLILALASCNTEKTDDGYIIEGTIDGLKDGKAVLAKLDLVTNERVNVDSTEITNGTFTFTGKLDHPYLHTIFLDESSKIHFFLENSSIEIHADVNDLKNVKIIGSREDSLFRSFDTEEIFEKDKGTEIMLNYPEYSFAAFTAYYQVQMHHFPIDTLDMIMNNFNEPVTHTEYYRHLKKIYTAITNVAISKPAPEFSIPDTTQKIIRLSEFRGSYVFLDFWASWCAPCRAVNPELVEIYNRFSSDRFNIIGISVDKDKEQWLNAIEKDKLPWINLSNLNGWDDVSTTYGVKAVPQNFLLDPDGIIIDKNLEPQDLVKRLEILFPGK